MKLSGLLLLLGVASHAVLAEDAAPEVVWGYQENSKSMVGPSQWSTKFEHCGGSNQSPIDIVVRKEAAPMQQQGQQRQVPLAPFKLAGRCAEFEVEEHEEGYNAVPSKDSTCNITSNGVLIPFAGFHFHTPSEHKLNGVALDAEVHFVHKTTDRTAASVIGLLLKKDKHANTPPFLRKFLRSLKRVGENKPVSINLGNFQALVKAQKDQGGVFNYAGGLTTPGCDEIVDWWVLRRPLLVAADDLTDIQPLMAAISITDHGRNARPTQPLNGRVVKEYR